MATFAQPNGIYEMTAADLNIVFDKAARKLVGLSGQEFVSRWNNGDFGPDPDRMPGVTEVAALMPTA
jgi:hypothetical protein